ncbi:DNA photolyase family protein [Flavobacteriaceae bacterium]|jgi:deoxyribodipyrimidine photo-lyase|nr:DNA photolyase family protein [Flavobacteriaceae bacterium]
MNETINVFWFRRDLRLEDNAGLFHALNGNHPVLAIFIFDKEIIDTLNKNDARLTFIHDTISTMNSLLNKVYNSSIKTFYGRPADIFNELSHEYNIGTVFTNHDYEPYAINRDLNIKNLLEKNNIGFNSFKDQVVFETNEIVKDDGLPYKVYTPYSKKWISALENNPIESFQSQDLLERLINPLSSDMLSLNDINFKTSNQKITPYNISDVIIDDYEATRNYPSKNGTSKIGPHLRFGTLSVRRMAIKAMKSDNITFLKELIWREFFMQILWHFPQTVTKSFKPQYEGVRWRNDATEFKAWCEGKTGYPLVDAGMRELNQTGFMHNRVRMLVGSFLCKHLLIDWRLGEAYFAEKLHDYEMSSNVGNWQWVAGCGVDASPYFRIFNPTTQIQKFDKSLEYIGRWVPDHQELTYPMPIVDHKFARERCLKTYKIALNKI